MPHHVSTELCSSRCEPQNAEAPKSHKSRKLTKNGRSGEDPSSAAALEETSTSNHNSLPVPQYCSEICEKKCKKSRKSGAFLTNGENIVDDVPMVVNIKCEAETEICKAAREDNVSDDAVAKAHFVETKKRKKKSCSGNSLSTTEADTSLARSTSCGGATNGIGGHLHADLQSDLPSLTSLEYDQDHSKKRKKKKKNRDLVLKTELEDEVPSLLPTVSAASSSNAQAADNKAQGADGTARKKPYFIAKSFYDELRERQKAGASAASDGFSILKAYGRHDKPDHKAADQPHLGPIASIAEASKLPQQKLRVKVELEEDAKPEPGEATDFWDEKIEVEDDDADLEEKFDVTAPESSSKQRTVPAKAETFFYIPDDYRIKDAIHSFCRVDSLEVIQKRFQKHKDRLVSSYKRDAKKAAKKLAVKRRRV